MGQKPAIRWAGSIAVAWLTLGRTASGAPAKTLNADTKMQARSTHRAASRKEPAGQSVAEVPLKRGIWEHVYAKGQLVTSPFQYSVCRDEAPPWHFFPSLFGAENFGTVLSEKVMSSDSVSRLPDGTYRVTGGKPTLRGGNISYVHLVTVHGDDSYEDAFTITSHAETKHPVHFFYTGRGHWVGPCAMKGK